MYATSRSIVMDMFAVSIALIALSPSPAGAEEPGKPKEGAEPKITNTRQPRDDAELKYWLGNMVWHHRYRPAEIATATGLAGAEIEAALRRFDIRPATRPRRKSGSPLLVLPYPGGRHPRIGFLDGAVRPQRETKVSVFTPWGNADDAAADDGAADDGASYVVVDVPEAIWSNLGLLYLAHTHVPTVWTRRAIRLEPLEWNRRGDGTLDIRRKLPDGTVFATKIVPEKDGVRMELSLTNGTKATLTDLRVQNCVMLKMAEGFNGLTNENKVNRSPYAACRSEDGKRWIITAWQPCHRTWSNARCPCLHSDPKFPDCRPGETQTVRGWLSFYEGADIQAEFRRLDGVGWDKR